MAQSLFEASLKLKSQIHSHDFSHLSFPRLQLPDIKVAGKAFPRKDSDPGPAPSPADLSSGLLRKIALAYGGVLELSGLNIGNAEMAQVVGLLATRRDITSLKLAKNSLTD
jgi:hypothetical protein